MAETYQYLGRATATGSAMVLTVSGIDQTYEDIEIVFHVISAAAAASSGKVTCNGDSGSFYKKCAWRINGTTLYGEQQSSTYWQIRYGQGAYTGPEYAYAKIYLPDYATAIAHPGVYRSSSWDSYTQGEQAFGGLLYEPSTPAAITSVTWTGVYTIQADCTMTVYGINYS